MLFLRFAEVRVDLGALVSKPMGPLVIEALRQILGALGSLRERLLSPSPKPKPKRRLALPTPSAPSILPRPVLVTDSRSRQEILESTPLARRRAVSTSTTYNAELTLPYRILWAKVIVRAAYDYALWRESPDIRLRRFAEDAARWLFDPSNPDLELSFENICFAFDFPVEKIRRKTRNLTREDVKKLEFRERQGRSELLGEISGGNGK